MGAVFRSNGRMEASEEKGRFTVPPLGCPRRNAVRSLRIIDRPSPRAFAAGRSPRHATAVVTTGILEVMTQDELEGELVHEPSPVRNRDILIFSIAVMSGQPRPLRGCPPSLMCHKRSLP